MAPPGATLAPTGGRPRWPKVTVMSFRGRVTAGVILARANLQLFERPDRLARSLLAMAPWGTTLPGVVAAAAGRYPDRVAIHDDDGSITYRGALGPVAADRRGVLARGVGDGTRIGLLCRNHRGFVEWLVAASATGADVVLLNTGFAAPQLAAVVRSEGVGLIVHDDEFADIVAGAGAETYDESAMQTLAGSAALATSSSRAGANGDPHVGDHGPAQGCGATERPGGHRGGRCRAGAHPVPARRHPGDRGAALPRLGTDESAPRPRTVHHQRAVPTLRCGSDASCHLRAPRPGAGGRAGDALADPRARSGRTRGGAHPRTACDRVEWLGPRQQAGHGGARPVRTRCSTTCTDRPRSPSRPSPHRPTCSRHQRPRAESRSACGSRSSTTTARPSPTATVGRVFVGGSMRFDGYTTGGEQGGAARAAVVGRPGLLPRRAAVRRGSRGRHDRVRRRERVPRRGRGAAQPPPVGRRSRRRRCRRRRVRAGARRVRRSAPRERSSPPTRCEPTSATISRDTRSPDGSSSSTSSRATRPARSCDARSPNGALPAPGPQS